MKKIRATEVVRDCLSDREQCSRVCRQPLPSAHQMSCQSIAEQGLVLYSPRQSASVGLYSHKMQLLQQQRQSLVADF